MLFLKMSEIHRKSCILSQMYVFFNLTSLHTLWSVKTGYNWEKPPERILIVERKAGRNKEKKIYLEIRKIQLNLYLILLQYDQNLKKLLKNSSRLDGIHPSKHVFLKLCSILKLKTICSNHKLSLRPTRLQIYFPSWGFTVGLVNKFTNYYTNTNECRLRQKKCKTYEKRKSSISKWPTFAVRVFRSFVEFFRIWHLWKWLII